MQVSVSGFGMVLTLCSFTVLLFILLYWFAYAPYQCLKKYGIKGPKPRIFFGNYMERMKMSLVKHDNYLTKRYGPVSGFYIGRQPHILISDLDMIKQIMVKEFQNFPDHPPTPGVYMTADQELTELPMATGEAWSRMRRILSPSFSSSRLKAILPLLGKSIGYLFEGINTKGQTRESFDVFSLFGPFAIQAILTSSFGYTTESRSDLVQLCKCVGILVSSMSEGQVERDVLLYSNFPWLLPLVHCFSKYSETNKAITTLENFALSLIKERRRTGHTSIFKDVLQLMVEASDPAHVSQSNKTMADKEIVANIVNFFVTNYDALAIHLCYTSYLLALNPDAQEKLQQEIDNYFRDKQDATLYEAAQEIEYLNNVIQESLRLYPPNHETDRHCNKTTIVGGVTIPKGAAVVIPIYTIHHNPSYWKDPEKFNPDRFKAEERKKQPEHCFIPFGMGPRTCIAMRFVQLVAKITIIELLKRYTFLPASDTEVPLQLKSFGIVMRPENGVHLKVITRSSTA